MIISNKDYKFFAIVIVNYNCSLDTIDTIKSLEKHNQNLFDIFLIDNNSKYEDYVFLKSKISKNINLIRSKKNLGFAGGNNILLKSLDILNYKYIFLLNPDTMIEDPNFFRIILEQIEEHNPDILGPLIRYYPEKDKIYFAGGFVNKYTGLTIMEGKKESILNYKNEKNFECDFITGCAMFVKSEVFKKIGFLPEEYFVYFEETDFCMKAKMSGLKILFTPKTFIFHKVSTSIKYLSNNYLYYMVRNFRIFANKYIKFPYIISFYMYYFFIWVTGYVYLCIRFGNLKGIFYIFKGIFCKG